MAVQSACRRVPAYSARDWRRMRRQLCRVRSHSACYTELKRDLACCVVLCRGGVACAALPPFLTRLSVPRLGWVTGGVPWHRAAAPVLARIAEGIPTKPMCAPVQMWVGCAHSCRTRTVHCSTRSVCSRFRSVRAATLGKAPVELVEYARPRRCRRLFVGSQEHRSVKRALSVGTHTLSFVARAYTGALMHICRCS